MSFFKKLGRKAPDTNAGTGLLESNQDAQNAYSDPPTNELFSTDGDYGLEILSNNTNDIIE